MRPFSSLFIGIALLTQTAGAAIPVHQAGSEKKDQYLDLGVFVGGRAHGPLALLNFRHSLTPRFERLVFDLGLTNTPAGVERPGFFHIAIQDKPKRIVVDLEDVTESKINPSQMAKLFVKSPFFNRVNFVSDPVHKNFTLEFPLKASAQIEVFELVTPGKPGRIVMDVRRL